VIGSDFLWLSVALLVVFLACAAVFAALMWRQNHDESASVVTMTGRTLTEAEIQELVDEAERGYNVREFKRR
jgi:uncharacterized protein YpuA (DUF1002 family)